MAMRTAKVLYEFSAEANSGEITIREGELITVTRTDIGEGWWEGTSCRGETGLFPEAYVEEIFEGSAPPPMAPPPLPQVQDYNAPAPSQNTLGATSPMDDWAADPWSAPPQQPPQPAKGQQDWNDDDFDSDFDDDSASQTGTQQHNQNALAVPSSNTNLSGSTGDISSLGRESKKMSATSKTSFNRFSPFVKSGAENYILGKIHVPVPPAEIVAIVELSEKKYMWESVTPPYSCTIASPKKDTKFKGLKSFIAYQLTPSFNNIQVSRRYKHFDWLHERLTAKFSYIPIPPLPDKQITGEITFMVTLYIWTLS
jgi:sorting nexin-9/18/33